MPTDGNGDRVQPVSGDVLNIVYLNPGAVDKGGFYPAGLNGEIRTSSAL